MELRFIMPESRPAVTPILQMKDEPVNRWITVPIVFSNKIYEKALDQYNPFVKGDQ